MLNVVYAAHPYLIVLHEVHSLPITRQLLKHNRAGSLIVRALREICINILRENIPTKPTFLRNYKRQLRRLASLSSVEALKKSLIRQREFLWVLLRVALPVVQDVVQNFKNASGKVPTRSGHRTFGDLD